MSVRSRCLVAVLTVIALQSTAPAQPLFEAERPALPDSGDTRIPINGAGDAEVMGAEATASSAIAAPVSLDDPIDPDSYICGPGDVFELNFWGRQNFRLRIAADLEGRTFISKVGYVAVAGSTLSAVRTRITKKVRANYPGLQFDLTLQSPRNFLVHVVENVRQPGSYVSHPLERVSAVLARAGGVGRGSRRKVTIQRKSGAQVIADLVLYELTGDVRHNPRMLDGDVIRIPAPETVVRVNGAVRRPGTYELVDTRDLTELLTLAGGLTSAAARSLPVRIVRRNDKQQAITRDLPYGPAGELPDTALHDSDHVYIRTTEELQRSVLLLGAVTGADALDAASTSRRLPFVEGDTVMSLIDRAGGIRAPGDLSRSYISRPGKGGVMEMIPIDLDALIVRRDFSADKTIQIGDTIVVPPMRHSVLVEGAVSRSGLYTYNPRFGINEYIAHAGGRTRLARDLDDVKVIKPNGKAHAYRSDLKLEPGDAILVPERNFSRPEVVHLVIAATGLVLSGLALTIAATR